MEISQSENHHVQAIPRPMGVASWSTRSSVGRASSYRPMLTGRLGEHHSHSKLLEIKLPVKVDFLLRAVSFLGLQCDVANADLCSYFLFQAALIPVHCLRSKPQSALAPEWRFQIESALEIVHSMATINPSAPRCRDVILSLCGNDLRGCSTDTVQPQTDFFLEPAWDAATWMAGCAPMLINEDLWAGSLDNTGTEFNFS